MSNETTRQTAEAFSPNGHKRAVLYARVSGDDTRKDGRNLQSQLDMCRQYATEHGYAITAELHEDDKGASGASFDLPQLGAILAMAELKEFDILVVRELDRLSRNLAKQLIVEESLKRNGVMVEYVLADYADTPEGNLQKHIRATVAEYEREKIKERASRGRRNVVRGGRIMLHGGKPPYGYRLVLKTRNGKSVISGLQVHEPEARIVRLVFEWYVFGDENGRRLSTAKIAERLTGMQVPTWADTHGMKIKEAAYGKWISASVLHLIRNSTYKGVWIYGKEKIPVEVPGIIESALWEKAQKVRKENRNIATRNVKREYLMRYKLTCSCGHAMHCRLNISRGKVYLYYMCNGAQTHVKTCPMGSVMYRADHLDALVWNWLREYFRDPADLRRKLAEYQAEWERINAPILALIQTNDDLLADNQGQLDRVKQMCEAGVYTIEESIERIHRLKETIASLTQARDESLRRLPRQLSNDDVERVMQFAYDMADGIVEADNDFEKRRHIIEALDVRGILTIENGDKICTASFILDDACQKGKQLVLPGRRKASCVACTDAYICMLGSESG